MTTAQEALQRLREGNERFASEANSGETFLRRMRCAKTNFEQKPFAIILGCSDSRVPVEIVFDQDLGDLFVIRVAGNIVSPSQLGSIEFAAEEFGARLVVVLGHTHCGAILGTLERLRRPAAALSPHTRFIADRIRPAVAGLIAPELGYDRETLIRKSVRANVQQSVEQLRRGSKILERLIAKEQLRVVGAEYSLETGAVEFFDNLNVTTAVDMPEARRRVVGNDIAGRGIDVDAATLTTTSHAQWSGAFAIPVDTVVGGSPER